MNRPPLNLHQKPKSIDVTLYEKEMTKPEHKRLVRKALPSLDMLKPEPPKNPRFLSADNQSVKKEMKARETGLTQNHARTSSARPSERSRQGGPRTQAEKFANQGIGPGAAAGGQPNPSSESRLRELGQRLFSQNSTSGEYLPDVADGPITALNTERFVYYSFFSRIEERIRPLWERNVEETNGLLPSRIQRQLTQHDWITGIEVILDANGNYIETVIHQTSGVEAIDQDAVQAFREAAIFPNPPQGMIQKDGRIHLKYAFIVQENPEAAWAHQ